MFFSTMSWYLADSSLNDYLKSQIVLQGQYYSDQPTNITKANFVSNTGLLTLEHLTLANKNILPVKNNQVKNTLVIDQVLAQLAAVSPSAQAQKNNNDISKKVQHITVEKVSINKLRFNLTETLTSDGLTNLELLQQQISHKLAADYPALYPEIAAKLYAKNHPELNAALVYDSQEYSKQKPKKETNQAIIESKASKHKKRLLGKATTRITILAFTLKSLEINHIAQDGNNLVQQFSNIELPVIGKEHGLASNQIGGEILRLLLSKANHLQ